MNTICGIDWSTGSDYTCIVFVERNNNATVTKSIYLTKEETEALQKTLKAGGF